MGINIEIDFADSFRNQMKALDGEYSEQSHSWYDLVRKIKSQYLNEILKWEITRAIVENCIGETDWKEYIKKRYEISEEELNEIINEVTEIIEKNGYFGMKNDDVATLKAFKALQKEWSFDICSLSEFEWYNKYFKNIINNTGVNTIVAHNGILCGDADFFFRSSNNENLATIVLLKDKYRPYLDVARDGVRGLTLETVSEIEIIKKNLTIQGFEPDGELSELREENYSYIAMADYCKLLRERRFSKTIVF